MAHVQYIVNKKGKKTGVFLSYTRYNRLLEDLHDLRVVAERRQEKPISLQQLKSRVRKSGV